MRVFFALLIVSLLTGCASCRAEGLPDNFYLNSPPREIEDLNFRTLSGEDVFLSDYKGQIVLINFWASWCAPCLEEMPDLNALQKRFQDRKIRVVTVTIEKKTENAVRFFSEHEIDALPLFSDPTGLMVFDMGFEGLPGSLVIDAQGREVAHVDGVVSWLSEDVSGYLLSLESGVR